MGCLCITKSEIGILVEGKDTREGRLRATAAVDETASLRDLSTAGGEFEVLEDGKPAGDFERGLRGGLETGMDLFNPLSGFEVFDPAISARGLSCVAIRRE